MGRKVASGAALVLLLLAVGGPSAQARVQAVSAVTVQVIGLGTVSSGSDGINCGNGLKACHMAFSGSGSITLTATPAAGWAFGSWTNCPTPSGNTCGVPVNGSNYDITANFTGPPTTTSTLSVTYSGSGTVTGGVINCGSGASSSACSSTVLTGSTLTVLEAPSGGQIFIGWSGACTGTSVSCTITMEADHKVNAAWASSAQTHQLTVSVSGGGSVKGPDINCPPSCTANLPHNSTEVLTATPSEGFAFTGWSGACSGNVPTCNVTMDADKSVGATFAAAPKLSVTVNGNGNVRDGSGAINCGNNGNSCSSSFAQGVTVTLTATPAIGSTFIGWSGACGGTALSCTVVMSEAKSVTATFSGGTVALTVSVSGLGRVSGGGINCGNGASTCSADQTPNASVTLITTPAAGATFAGWGGACTGTSPSCTVSMTSAKSASATFTGGTSTVQLNVSVTGKGTVSGGGIRCGAGGSACTVSVPANSSVLLTASPAKGAKFKGWAGACTGTKTTCTVTVDAAKTVGATFTGGSSSATLAPLAAQVKPSGGAFLVTLRFTTTLAGTAQVRALRAGRVVSKLSRRVAAGTASIGPFRVANPGLYTFQLQLGGHTIRWRKCLGRCGAAAPGPRFVLERGTPTTTRSGDVWSVTLHVRAKVVFEAQVRAFRGSKLLLDRHFLGGAGARAVGPFLLAPGSYTLRLTATDAFGRVRGLNWIVNLAR
jgi:uncharacterized repeat protein (TIGR02543 family)